MSQRRWNAAAWSYGIVTIAMIIASEARAIEVDWKVYGAASLDGAEICFYDAKGVVRAPEGHLRVWTKCLSQKDLNDIDVKHDFGGKIMENSAQKVARYYVPPIVAVGNLDLNQAVDALDITIYEEAANISGIKPHARVFYELDCSQKMLRELSIDLSVKGKQGSRHTPRAWEFISPETNAATLLKILCSPPTSRP